MDIGVDVGVDRSTAAVLQCPLGRHYVAKPCRFPARPWTIEALHVESLPPVHASDGTWLARAEAPQAADKLLADLGHAS